MRVLGIDGPVREDQVMSGLTQTRHQLAILGNGCKAMENIELRKMADRGNGELAIGWTERQTIEVTGIDAEKRVQGG